MYIIYKNNKTHQPSRICTQRKQTPNNGENSTHITKAGTERREQLQLILDSNSIQIEQKPTGQIRCGNKSIRKRKLRWHNVVTNQRR